MITKLLWISLLFAGYSCAESINGDKDDTKIPEAPAEIKTAILESNNSFAFEMFSQIKQNDDADENIFISPISIYYALSLAANGSNGDTYEAFDNVLHYASGREAIFEHIHILSDYLVSGNDIITLEIANSIWSHIDFPVKPKFQTDAELYFNATCRELDFTDLSSLDTINSWIEEKTHDKIRKMLTEISPETVMFLINAIYFKADWLKEFNEESTYESNFRPETGEEYLTDFMSMKEQLPYYENDTLTAVKLAYADSNYSMVVMLPKSEYSSDDLIWHLNNKNWQKMMSGFNKEEVNLMLPKFKFTYGVRKLKKELVDMGLGIAFSDEADFSNISYMPVQISNVLHKSFIDVNEKGSEAAAATVVIFEYTSINNSAKYFTANHPFIFAICEEQTNTILFMGRVSKPEYEE